MEKNNVYGVRWRELKPGQHAIVGAGGSADLLGGRGVEVRAFLTTPNGCTCHGQNKRELCS